MTKSFSIGKCYQIWKKENQNSINPLTFHKYNNFHTLRDTFAVRCLRTGMSVENLSYVLGHASVTVTAERYKKFLKVKQEQITVLRRIMELV